MSATTLHELSIQWSHAHFYANKAWREAQDKARDEWIAKLEKRLHARRLAHAVPPPPPTSGSGWRILSAPKCPHERLDAFARDLWDIGFHHIPWPDGWKVFWADLRLPPRRDPFVRDIVLGRCVLPHKLLLIDEAQQRGRTWRQFAETVLHEIAHAMHPKEVHGENFAETLRRVLAHVLPEPDSLIDTEGSMNTTTPKATDLDPDWEYAALARNDGTPIVRTAALESLAKFKRAIAANGGRAPTGPDGQPMYWSEGRGWLPRSAPHGGTSLLEAMRRQLRVAQQSLADARQVHGEPVTDLATRLHAERRARLEQERAADEQREAAGTVLYASASAEVLEWWRRFCIGFAGNAHPAVAECTGKQLAYYFPSGRPTLAARAARFERLGYWEPL